MLYPVHENDRYGYIDSTGMIIVPLTYYYCDVFAEGMGAIFDDYRRLFRVDASGGMTMLQENVAPTWVPFREGAIVVERDEKEGVLSSNGDWIVPPKFVNAFSFSGGIAVIEVTPDCMGAVDKTGNWIIPPHFTWLTGFAHDCMVALATTDPFGTRRKFYLVSKTGERVTSEEYFTGSQGSKGRVPVAKECVGGVRYGVVDEQGDVVVPYIFDRIEGGGNLEYRGATLDGETWGAIDVAGNWVVEPKFQMVHRYSEGLFIAGTGGTWRNGQLTDPKFGYINRNGEWVIPPQFDDAWPFKEGIARVSFNLTTPGTLSGYINREGRYIWEPRR